MIRNGYVKDSANQHKPKMQPIRTTCDSQSGKKKNPTTQQPIRISQRCRQLELLGGRIRIYRDGQMHKKGVQEQKWASRGLSFLERMAKCVRF